MKVWRKRTMIEPDLARYLRNIGVQLNNQQMLIVKLEQAISNLRIKGQVAIQTMPFGIKDITTAQLVDAYKRGLNLEQLTALANGKYTPEQIQVKIIRSTGGNC